MTKGVDSCDFRNRNPSCLQSKQSGSRAYCLKQTLLSSAHCHLAIGWYGGKNTTNGRQRCRTTLPTASNCLYWKASEQRQSYSTTPTERIPWVLSLCPHGSLRPSRKSSPSTESTYPQK